MRPLCHSDVREDSKPKRRVTIMKQPPHRTKILAPDPDGIAHAAALLSAGQLVAIPTETVYGLAGDARNAGAVAAIFAAKGRPSFNPLIVHVASVAEAQRIAELPPAALSLASAFWPGPLTLVAPLRPGHGLAPAVTAGLQTVAIRVPAHPLAQRLLAESGAPLAAPSANPSGRISPTTVAHVLSGLEGRIAAILDGGSCAVGVESTIVGFENGTPVILREGGISREAITTCLGACTAPASDTTITAPGQLASHYAPRATLRLNAVAPKSGEIWIGFGPQSAEARLTLSPTGNLDEAASRLFAVLHEADATGQPIAVAPVPDHGLGAAINDRLRRAAAPRSG